MPERRVWNSKITNLFQRKLKKYGGGVGADAQFTTDNAGWYITIGGEITLYVGEDRPEFEIGDSIRLTIEKATANAQA
jgi:hypothetical protein